MRYNFILKRIIIISALFMLSSFVFSQKVYDAYDIEKKGYFICPRITTRGIVVTDNFASKIYLIQNKKIYELINSPGCGRYYSVSPDKSKIGFKIINSDGSQTPAIFDLNSMKIKELSSPVNLCGQVSFSNDGKIAYTIDNELYVIQNDITQIYNLNTYSNITPISPDGNFVVYNNDDDQLFMMNLVNGNVEQITTNSNVYAYPQWSPDGSKVAYSTLSGTIMIFDKSNANTYIIGAGENISWSDNSQYIIFNRTIVDNFQLIGSDIYIAKFDGSIIMNLTNTSEHNEISPSFGLNNTIIYSTIDEKGKIISQYINLKNFRLSNKHILYSNTTQYIYMNDSFNNAEQIRNTRGNVMVSGDVPYVHQVYDTPNWHNGHSSCAPTTAIMAIAYYNRLPYWDITCSSPSSHTSHYGAYVADRYTYNSTYYNYTAGDAGGNTAWGGYGYMWTENYSPYSRMASYISMHNITSVRSTSTSFTNVQTEINNSYPFPICSMLTSAGHLTLAVGYVNGQHTLIFNDPYGNKNNGYMNYYGKNVYYDWPGYNNGFQNLNYIAWTVTARANQLTYNNTIIDDVNYNHGFYIHNQGISLMRYYRDSETGGYGAFSHYWWTYTTSSTTIDTCYVKWTPTLPSSGNYNVYAYIPSTGPTATSARYKIYYNGGSTTVVINQAAHLGQWVSLGTFPFAQGSSGYVRLGDGTGIQSQVIAFDAMKWELSTAAPVANFEANPTSICAGNSVQFTNLSTNATSYNWTFTGGNPSSSTNANPVVIYTNPGNYSVTLIATGPGGSNTMTKTNYITVNPKPNISIYSTRDSICKGDTIIIFATGGDSYLWSHNLGSQPMVTIMPEISTTYFATATNSFNCSNVDSISIIVNQPPNISINAQPSTICQGDTAIITATGAHNYYWSSNANNDIISVSPNNSTSYIVTGYSNDGCSSSVSVAIIVKPIPPKPIIIITNNSPFTLMSTSDIGNQWYLNDNPISGATEQTYIVNENGNYFTIVTIDGCSSLPSNQITINNVGINDYTNDEILIYPNPAQDIIYIQSPNPINEVMIINNLGQIVAHYSDTGIINIGQLANGVYQIMIKTEDNIKVLPLIKK